MNNFSRRPAPQRTEILQTLYMSAILLHLRHPRTVSVRPELCTNCIM